MKDSHWKILVKMYKVEIVMRHGVPVSIVSSRDPKFNSRTWRQFHDHLEAKLKNEYDISSTELQTKRKDYSNNRRSPTYWDKVGERKLLAHS